MLVAKQDFRAITSGVTESAAFKVEMNAMMFSAVINGIYADKIQSPIRELSTNARDGHRAAGCLNKPFDVFLPSSTESVFWVRDYGCSLTHDEVMGLYSTMFASTKRGSNDDVGMIGLGSKSPFAYTSGFSVTCWKDKEERSYSCFLGDDGVPQIALLDRRPSNEPQGVRVSIPVSYNDIDKFRTAARAVFFGFDVKPNVLNELYTHANPTPILQGSNWWVYDEGDYPLDSGIFVRQGCVIYPVSEDFRRGHFPNAGRHLKLLIDFPIGQLSVSTSREALGYDKITTENLQAGIGKVIEEITKGFEDKITKQATYWDACEYFQKMINNSSYSSRGALLWLCRSCLTYKGMKLRKAFDLGIETTTTPGMIFNGIDDDAPQLGKVNYSLSFRKRSQGYSLNIQKMEQVKLFVEFDDTRFGAARMRQVLDDATSDDIIVWMRPQTRMDLDTWLKDHGGITWTDLSTIEPLKTSGMTKRGPAVKFRYLMATSYKTSRYDKVDAVYEPVVPDTKMLFIRQNGADLFPDPNGRRRTLYEVQSMLRELVCAGILGDGTKVYLVNGSNTKAVERQLGSIPDFHKTIYRLVSKKYKVDELKLVQDSYEAGKCRQLAKHLRNAGVILQDPAKTFVDSYLGTNNANPGPQLTDSCRAVLNIWAPQVFVKTEGQSHETAAERVYSALPLLRPIISGSYGGKATAEHLKIYLTLLNKADSK